MNEQSFDADLEALLEIYDAAYSKNQWLNALDALGNLTSTSGIMLYVKGPLDDLTYEVGSANSHFENKWNLVHEYTQRFVRDPNYSFDYDGDNYVTSAPVFEPILDTDIWPIEQYENIPEVIWCRDHLGIFRRFFFNLSRTRGLKAAIIFQYASDVVTQSQTDVSRMQKLMRHLGKALEINRFYAPLRERYNAVLAALNNVELGLCITDANGRIVVANTYAQDLFDQKDGILFTREGHIGCRDEDESQRLRDALKQVGNTAAGQDKTSELQVVISRTLGNDPILAIVSPLRDSEVELDRGLTGCMVTLVDSARSSHARIPSFAEAYALTKAETAIADLMAGGGTAREIADARGVSPETAANQIKSVLSKTTSRNRAQFLWKVFQFSPPVS